MSSSPSGGTGAGLSPNRFTAEGTAALSGHTHMSAREHSLMSARATAPVGALTVSRTAEQCGRTRLFCSRTVYSSPTGPQCDRHPGVSTRASHGPHSARVLRREQARRRRCTSRHSPAHCAQSSPRTAASGATPSGAHVCVCMRLHTCVRVRVRVRVCTCASAFLRVRMCACVRTRAHACCAGA